MKKILIIVLVWVSTVAMGQSAAKADALFGDGDYVQAGKLYGQLVRQSPKNALYTYRYARCLQETGNHWEAIDYFHQSGERFVLCHFFMGESYMKIGMPDEAIREYEDYLEKATSTDRIARIEEQLRIARQQRRYLKRVRRIGIIDSVRVGKAELLSAYHLSADAGSLRMDTDGGVCYLNQRQDREVCGAPTEKGSLLVGRYRLLDAWTKADTLSENVNFTDAQNYPFFLSDGVTLYYGAIDTAGLGGWDIYMTQYNSATDTYLRSENIGYPFNSSANDYLYALDESTGCGYFASDRFCPSDSVTVYRFRHEETPRYWSGIRSDSLLAYATMTLVERDTLPIVETKRHEETVSQPQQEPAIHFVLNNEVCYTRYDQFLSEEARQSYQTYEEEQRVLEQLTAEIDRLRKQYGETNPQDRSALAQQLLTKEKEREALQSSAKQALREALQKEQEAMRTSAPQSN